MSNNKYPRIGQRRRINRPQGQCVICGHARAEARVIVQYSFFRGGDSVFKVHHNCIKGMHEDELLRRLHGEKEKAAFS